MNGLFVGVERQEICVVGDVVVDIEIVVDVVVVDVVVVGGGGGGHVDFGIVSVVSC